MVPSSDDKLPRGLKRPYSSGFQQVKLEVIFTDVKTIPPYLDLHEEAEIMLDAGKNDLQEDQLEDKFVYANPRGLSILEQLEKLDRQTNITQFQLATVTREVAGLNRQQKESDQKIRALTKSSEGYRKVCNRFLGVYLRDILNVQSVEPYRRARKHYGSP